MSDDARAKAKEAAAALAAKAKELENSFTNSDRFQQMVQYKNCQRYRPIQKYSMATYGRRKTMSNGRSKRMAYRSEVGEFVSQLRDAGGPFVDGVRGRGKLQGGGGGAERAERGKTGETGGKVGYASDARAEGEDEDDWLWGVGGGVHTLVPGADLLNHEVTARSVDTSASSSIVSGLFLLLIPELTCLSF